MNTRRSSLSKTINASYARLTLILVITAVLVVPAARTGITHSVEPRSELDKFTAHFNARIPALMKDYGIPGVSVAIIKDGQTAWTSAYGYADPGAGRKMTVDTCCRVESLSKSVTAWGVMKLAEQGMIDLDAPVIQYLNKWSLPESPFPEEKVTVRQMLTHTSGMPLGDFTKRFPPDGDIPSLEESMSAEAVLIREPGRSFSYSNTGYNILEILIEEITGRDFAEYMKNEVLIPLGMRHSDFNWRKGITPAVPVGHDLKGRPVPVYVYPVKASGGLFADVRDMAAFMSAGMTGRYHAENRVLSSQGIEALYSPRVKDIGVYGLVFDSYGMGYYIENLPGGIKSIANGGQGYGVMTHLQYVPGTGDGIVILTNSQRSWPFFALILTDWAEWCGFKSVGMGVITGAGLFLWLIIGLCIFIALWQVWRPRRGLLSGSRSFAPFSRASRFARILEIMLSLSIFPVLLWAVNQEYLFLSSVFPVASVWLGYSLLALASVLFFSSMFPVREE